ncbi:putative polyamine transporter [Hibiscus syriacus]|uniref:Polyamine transporter n=1 Tax=Hibiscus syriacus TaxID=106335 RepID=A0A6A2ZMI9_HIBSY|nr:putative polyamine transporter [Hibiscus syriacus]
MSLVAIPKIQPHRWISLVLAGEVDNPQKTFPRALLVAVVFTCVAYLVPLFAVIGAVSVDQNDWESGFHAYAAEMIAGKWLKVWIEVGAVLSAIGLFEAQLSACAYQLEGMADLSILPKFFSSRSKWFDTPWVGILISTLITIGMSRKLPEIKRPYRVPLRIPGLVLMCLIPSAFLVVIMVIATKIVYLVSGVMTVGAIGWYFLMNFCREKKLFKYSIAEDGER